MTTNELKGNSTELEHLIVLVCGMKFEDEKHLKIHCNTHKKRESKGKKQKQSTTLPDFDKPDFSHVM